jgi:hypothetical protein
MGRRQLRGGILFACPERGLLFPPAGGHIVERINVGAVTSVDIFDVFYGGALQAGTARCRQAGLAQSNGKKEIRAAESSKENES